MIPFKPAEDLFALLVPVAALLLALLAAAAAALWYARRRGAGFAAAGKARRLRVLERLALSRHVALVLVEYDGRPILLGQSGERLSLIERGAAKDTAAGDAA